MAQGLKWMLDPESPFYIKPRLDLDLISWILKFKKAATVRQSRAAMPLLRDLSWKSLALYEQLATEEGLEFGFQKRGLLMLFATEKGEHALRHEAALARQIGVEALVLDRFGLEVLEPGVSFGAAGGVYYPGDAHLSPAAFLVAMTDRLRAMGVTILPGTGVLGMGRDGARFTGVRTTSGTFEGDVCVVAGGAWSQGLVRDFHIRLPLQPGKGYSVTIDHPSVQLTIPSVLTEARVAVTPLGHQLRLAGTMELAGLDLSISRRRVEAIIRAVPRYYTGFSAADVDREHPWRGLRPCSPDGLPYLGPLRSYRNLIVATGHAMVGTSLGPVTGSLVADLVAGRAPSIDIDLLDPERFS
jgi:D-amino-acid dehydrogenase